jgi:putative selenate reductase
VTVCTDLLKAGGYGRLPRYLESLEARMRELGVASVGDYVLAACGKGEEAAARVSSASPLALVREAAVLNTPVVVARVLSDPRYRQPALRPPRKIGRHLALFDCINCDKCLPTCPNDANFVYEVEPLAREYENYRVEAGRAVTVAGGRFEVRERRQIGDFQDFCNDCGNCDTFCPEDGGPHLAKARFFGSLETFRRTAERDGFCVEATGEGTDAIRGRLAGVEYRLAVNRGADQAVFSDGRVRLQLRHRARVPVGAEVEPGTPDGHTLDVSAYLRMALVLDGVLDRRRANPVNAAVR